MTMYIFPKRYKPTLSERKLRVNYTTNYLSACGGEERERSVSIDSRQSTGASAANCIDYVSNMILKDGKLSCLRFENGMAEKASGRKSTAYNYSFNFTDHLGNVRVVASADGRVLETNDYYPYGMLMGNSSSDYQPFKYSSKELDRMNGLNLYDHGARMSDPALGRWHVVDPLAEKYPEMSPYVMCADNPMNYVDRDGKKPTKEEAARMAAHVYGDKSDKILSGGWIKSAKEFGVKLQRSSGLCSAVYERTVKGKTEYVYATAGTQDWKGIKEDVKQIVGVSKQYAEAVENAKEISKILGGNTELNFVGHSLGGGEAALNSLVTSKDNLKGREAITFNAAYVTNLTKIANGHWYTPFKSENRITAYVMMFDPLNRLTAPANGKMKNIFPKNLESIYNGHSIDNVLRCFDINP